MKYSMRSALTHQPIVYQEFGCYGFESYDSYEGFEGSDGFERLSGMYFGRLCAIVALKGFGAPISRYFGGTGLLGTSLASLGRPLGHHFGATWGLEGDVGQKFIKKVGAV